MLQLFRRFTNLFVVACLALLPLLSVQKAVAAGTNLIANPSVETTNTADTTRPQSWNKGGWGTNTSTFSYDATGRTGKGVTVTTSSYTNGDAKWYFDHVAVTAGTTYTFSDYYKATVSTELVVEAKNASGQASYVWLATLPATSQWTAASYAYTPASGITSASVFHLIGGVGSLSTDDYSLTANETATAPTVAFSTPAQGATVSGTQTITATASGTTPIAGVQFKVDSTNLGSEVTAAPYSVNWTTNTVANGSHTLTATARNTAGLTTSVTRTVTVSNTTTTPTDPNNLIANPSMETVSPSNSSAPDQWQTNNWGTNTAVFTYPSGGRTGSRSVKTQITQYTSGDAKWYFAPVTVQPNTTYTFSDYYKSTVATSVIAQVTSTTGAVSYIDLGSAPIGSNWTQFAANVTTPANAQKLSIFHVISAVGSLQLDDASLTTYTPPAVTGYIANNSMETAATGDSTSPASWQKSSWGTNTSTFKYMNEGHTGSKSARVTISNYTDGDAKWYFNPITNLQPGGQYRMTAWYKTNTTPHAVAMYQMADGTTKYFGMPNPFPPSGSNTTWQKYSETFTVPVGAQSVSAFMFISGNGWLQTDDYTLEAYQPIGFNRPLVSLTFDDGFEENNLSALPILNSYGFKTTQCYATQFVQEDPNNANLILQFKNSGHEICSHTITHPFLTQLTNAQLKKELSESQSYLQNLTGSPVRDFASPYGDYNEKVNTQIKKYYRSHRTVDEGYNSKDNFDIYRIRVQNIQSNTTLAEVQSWLDHAKATNTWLVLVYHKVWTSDVGQFDSYTSDFAAQMQALKNSGLTVKTYSDALDEVISQL